MATTITDNSGWLYNRKMYSGNNQMVTYNKKMYSRNNKMVACNKTKRVWNKDYSLLSQWRSQLEGLGHTDKVVLVLVLLKILLEIRILGAHCKECTKGVMVTMKTTFGKRSLLTHW